MKVGAENRKKLIFAGMLLAAAAFLFIRMLVGWNSAAASVPVPKAPQASDFEQATAATPTPPSAPAAKRAKGQAQPSLDPRLRLNLLAQSERLEYKGAGRNIFDRESMPEIPAPFKNGMKEASQPPPQPVYTPPPPPQINLKFFGFTNPTAGGSKQIFLSQGEEVWVAKEGDTINRRYKVLHINPNSVEIQDVLSNNTQTIPLTQG